MITRLPREEGIHKSMASTLIGDPNLLTHLLSHLTRQDAIMVALTCTEAAMAYKAVHTGNPLAVPLHNAAPLVIVCASGSRQLLLLTLASDGKPYTMEDQTDTVGSRTRRRRQEATQRHQHYAVSAVPGSKCRSSQWLTGIAISPYDQCVYVAAYGTGHTPEPEAAAAAPVDCALSESRPGRALRLSIPAQVLRFTPGTLRPAGQLVSGPAIEDPEGLAFAKGSCYVASTVNASVVCVGLPDGNIRQSLALDAEAVPWGMAAWDPNTYPQHAAAAQRAQQQQQQRQQGKCTQAGAAATRACSSARQQQEPGADQCCLKSGGGSANSSRTPDAALALGSKHGPVGACWSQAAQGCLLVAVQMQAVGQREYWLPPRGPASGVLLCVPLCDDGVMQPWMQWSRSCIKRPSGISIDHAGHVWTTSLDQLLLCFSGPCHVNSGCLLQQVDLTQLLPSLAAQLYPMDVQAAVQLGMAAMDRPEGQEAQHQTSSAGCLLLVTMHAGPKVPGAIGILKVMEQQPQQQQKGERFFWQSSVSLVSCWQDRLLQQPNMVAIQ